MPTILLVDDDALTAMGSADMIEDLGHEVLTAPSGRAALTILSERNDVDLVITDQSMPGMTGTQLAMTIRERSPGLPIVIASGYGDLPEAAGLRKLPKPYDQRQLDAMIGEMIAR